LGEGQFKRKIRAALDMPETLPAMRRYFVNTMFDATFVMLGVIIGSALSSDPRLDVIITTLVTSAVALAISTGTSVYEAETLEQTRRLDEIGRAMLTSVGDTSIGRASKVSINLIALINSLAPIVAGTITIVPFLLISESDIILAAETSVALAISMLFMTGFFMGRSGKGNPLLKGARMATIGFVAFLICYFISGAI
jgi:predicted membrane protein (TIGR00267 family)